MLRRREIRQREEKKRGCRGSQAKKKKRMESVRGRAAADPRERGGDEWEGSKEKGLGLMGGTEGGRQAEKPTEEGIPILLEDSPAVKAGSRTETLGSQWESLTTLVENLTGRIQTDGVLVLDLHLTMTVDPQGQATLLILCLVTGALLPSVEIGLQGQVTQTKAEEGQCKGPVVLGILHRAGEPRQGLQVVLHQSCSEGPH